MFDEEPLDPHGVGNLPHVLNKSSTFGVRGRVDHVQQSSSLPLLEFQTKERAGNEDVLAVLPPAYGNS